MTGERSKRDRADSLRELLGPLDPFLDDDISTELVMNEENVLYTMEGNEWIRHDIDMPAIHLDALATAAARFVNSDISEDCPIITAQLPAGQRIQITQSPVTQNTTITIRKPARKIFTYEDFEAQGYFEFAGSPEYLSGLIRDGKTIVVAGSTNSGKTALLNTMLNSAPIGERIITIQDVMEIQTPHPNTLHLMYMPNGVTPTELVRCALRQNGDRIVLGECRGREAHDWLQISATGHQGAITSLHADSCALALERLAAMAMEHSSSLPHDVIVRTINLVLDVIIHVRLKDGRRYITEILEVKNG